MLQTKFHICLISPPGYLFDYLFDDVVLKPLLVGFHHLGMNSVTLARNGIDTDRVNLIVGGHMLVEADMKMLEDATYIVVQTETLSPDSVGPHRCGAWIDSVFSPFLQNAMAVVDFTSDHFPILSKWGVERKAVFTGGYAPELRTVTHMLEKDKDIDFLFIGSMTEHRQEVLARLKEKGKSVGHVFGQRSLFRDSFIARSKVNVCPVQGEFREFTFNHLNWSRLNLLLNNQACVAVEQPEGSLGMYKNIGLVMKSMPEYVDFCLEMLENYTERAIMDSLMFETNCHITNSMRSWLNQVFDS